jgi:hypothetical protein
MNASRWYPTNTTLPNGEVLVVAGTMTQRRGSNRLPQVWTKTGRWRNLTRAKRALPEYPFMHLAPNGKVFMSGPGTVTSYLDPAGRGKWTTVGRREHGSRLEGTAVLYDDGKVLTLGGGDPPQSSAEVIDLNLQGPAWRNVSPMLFPRRHHNATLLPDGTVLVTGGTAGEGFNDESAAVLQAELWDPVNEQFVTVASMAVPRIYHSVALLLPDGRVLSAGGEGEGGQPRPNAELYSPPYLFRGPRPSITAAPGSVTYGQLFALQTPDAPRIRKVTWIRLPSVTHGFNMDQRSNRLVFTATGGALNVQAPSDRNLCPPGHYMLFILDESGVPSTAKIVRIN